MTVNMEKPYVVGMDIGVVVMCWLQIQSRLRNMRK